ncbi:Leucine-rich repeat protein kinase family protein [Theobroma cacao]|uniref:non-specific serine/threonine protein kinase n=1 Tax=Theobroma cacao TaxID=3641 RepID=A0A061GFJ9_THECC|nr:Leucine-rich repeat protein kinase family protein [Theobroma cacao]
MDDSCFNFLSLLLIQCFMGSLAVITAANLTTDQYALLEFKDSLDSDTILANNWTSSTSVCNWVGVSCSSSPERVTSLNLRSMDLTGTISPHLGDLSSLLSLDLSGNKLNGYLPSTIYNLSSLQIMDLTSNELSGDFPDDFCRYFPKLEVLHLAFNGFSGSVPSRLGDCTNLRNLSLSNNRFYGFIPRSIGNLTRLKEIRLSGNSLQGAIPWEIGNLFNLEIFAAESNGGLTGGIPASIFNISSLTKLVLFNNSLSGSLPDNMCHHLSKLEVLIISLNEFSGHIPSSIGECSNLQNLSLSTNRFNGTIPRSFGNLTSLKRLSLRENDLTGEIPWEIGNLYSLEILAVQHMRLNGPIPPSIFNISSLKEISLNNNSLSGEIPSMISISNLEELRLWGNNLSGNIPNFISSASKLRILALEENSFFGLIPNTLGNLTFLERLSLASNNLITETSTHEWSFLSSLANCRNLRYLNLSFNPLNGILPSSISNLSTSLHFFYASDVKITGSIPREIGNLSNITTLDLSHNELSGSIPATIGRLRNVQGLLLHGNQLQGSIPPSVCGLERLYNLSLGGNMLHGPIPTCLANLTSLRYLYLDSNKLNSTIPLSLWSLNDILEVDLSSNYLNGSLPLGIEKLKVLTHLNLSRNLLSGEILSSIGELQDLISLDLSNNRFDGYIPESFGDLISLESLDLSNNNLSGVIPKSLERLSSLNHFNVSFNRLEGEIPSGGPFRNFSAKSFMNNCGLCGSPALQVPPCKSRQSKMTPWHVLKYVLPVVASLILIAIFFILLKRCQKKSINLAVNEDLLPLEKWRRISYSELLQATNGFDECNLLGSGGFGSVYRGTLSDGMNVAIKVFNMHSEDGFKSFDVECEAMRNIFHRNLVKVFSSCSNVDFRALMFEFMPNGNLEKWLYSYNYFLNLLQRIDIMIDVASALEYLHFGCSVPVIHCDLKPSNILLDNDMVAHVGDFGLAKLLGEEDSIRQTKTLATIGYMAPEYGSTGIVSLKGDVYSYGILLMETFTRKKPTDEIFSVEMSLKDWVKNSLSNGTIDEVLDANLLREEEHFIDKVNALSSIMGLALDCTTKLPEERKNMKDVVAILKKIKIKFLKDVEMAYNGEGKIAERNCRFGDDYRAITISDVAVCENNG